MFEVTWNDGRSEMVDADRVSPPPPSGMGWAFGLGPKDQERPKYTFWRNNRCILTALDGDVRCVREVILESPVGSLPKEEK